MSVESASVQNSATLASQVLDPTSLSKVPDPTALSTVKTHIPTISDAISVGIPATDPSAWNRLVTRAMEQYGKNMKSVIEGLYRGLNYLRNNDASASGAKQNGPELVRSAEHPEDLVRVQRALKYISDRKTHNGVAVCSADFVRQVPFSTFMLMTFNEDNWKAAEVFWDGVWLGIGLNHPKDDARWILHRTVALDEITYKKNAVRYKGKIKTTVPGLIEVMLRAWNLWADNKGMLKLEFNEE